MRRGQGRGRGGGWGWVLGTDACWCVHSVVGVFGERRHWGRRHKVRRLGGGGRRGKGGRSVCGTDRPTS